jgi:trans-2,3-dihydro-3-hydroxyanthranilate isomerase
MARTARAYAIYDVFTDMPLAGNGLAVVFDSEGLGDERMQQIAREFNQSETVFIGPASEERHSASLRIFTPSSELPFAGHPTVGAAIALAEKRYPDGTDPGGMLLALEEKVGLVRAAVSRNGGALFAEFDLPQLPQQGAFDAEKDEVAAALGLSHADIGFENHFPAVWSAGVPYATIPVGGLDAAARAKIDMNAWLEIFNMPEKATPSPFIYCRDTVNHDCAFHARMFAPHHGIPEDPATGSAVAAFAGTVALRDEPTDGLTQIWIEQGLEMGRPSRIRLELDISSGHIEAARIGGHAICVAQGMLSA